MKSGLRVTFGLSGVIGSGVLFASSAQAAVTRYTVYCANEKTEIDSRTLQQMQQARGSNVCALSSFSSLSSAEDFANKNFGSAKKCSCS